MSTLKVDNLLNAAGNESPISVPGAAKAWITFNGTGTVANRDKFNIATITDNGTGDYTLTFTNNMSSSDYVVVGSSGFADGGAWTSLYIHTKNASPFYQEPTTSAFRVTVAYSGTASNIQDFNRVSIAVFGD